MLIIFAFIMGIVEGLTEFMPVSSSGHMILIGNLLYFKDENAKTFEILIQLGACLAVIFLYWRRILIIISRGIYIKKNNSYLHIGHIFFSIFPTLLSGFFFIKK